MLSAINPATLRKRLDQDIKFSHEDLKSDFNGFIAHATNISESFERIDSGPQKSRNSEKNKSKTRKDKGKNSHVG